MSVLDLARRDWKAFSQSDFSEEITLKPSSLAESVTVRGLATNHHYSVDDDGIPVNSKNVHITISEEVLTEAGYTVRNSDNEVDMVGHLVTFRSNNYKIAQTMPDNTIDHIVCFLVDYE